MRTHFWLGSLLALTLLMGCGKSNPTPAAAGKTDAPPDVAIKPEPLPEPTAGKTEQLQATEDTMPPPDEGEDPDFSPQREAELAAQLEKEPQNGELLLKMAELLQTKSQMTESGELDYELIKKSASYLRQALAADPSLADTEVRTTASTYFYNEACAYAREKKPEEGVKALQAAVEYGWNDSAQIKNDPDLANLRELPSYTKVLETAVKAHRAGVETAVNILFSENHDFKFDFNLKDTDGKPVAKKDFDGKLLMVNVWGTWCPPCRKELPDLAAAFTKYQSQGFEIVGLNTESETGDEANVLIKEAQKKYGINYRCALGNEDVFQQIPNYSAVPTSIFFDRSGKPRVVLVGMADEMLLEVIIERLMKESPTDSTGA